MGRKKTYDEDEVLHKAMILFWNMGYNAVSTRELAAAMGINQYSLYASFTSKEILFERALERYYTELVKVFFIKPIMAPGANKATLHHFFQAIAGPNKDGHFAGCLICNTMTDAQPLSTSTLHIIEKFQDLMLQGFTNILHADFPNAQDAEILAKASILLNLVIGIAVRNRTNPADKDGTETADQVIALIYGDYAASHGPHPK